MRLKLMAAATADEKTAIANEINVKLNEEYGTQGGADPITVEQIDEVLESVFSDLFDEQAMTYEDRAFALAKRLGIATPAQHLTNPQWTELWSSIGKVLLAIEPPEPIT
jgi:hypothetical protein